MQEAAAAREETLAFNDGLIPCERIHYWSDFIAGCIAGSAGIIAGYPLDTIKVKQQTYVTSTLGRWSVLRTACEVLNKQGPKMLYVGMAFPTVTEGIRSCLFFGIYGKLLGLDKKKHDVHPRYVDIAAASGVAAAVQGLAATPVELVKIQMQTHTGAQSFSGFGQCVRHLYGIGGVRGMFHGTTITIMREVPALVIYMSTYSALRRNFTPVGQQYPSLCLDLLAGGMAGTASWMITIPLDVIKTRIQSDNLADRRYTGGIRHCLVSSWKADGVCVFWRGLGATCLRAFPTNAVTLVIYSKSLVSLHDLEDQWSNARYNRRAVTRSWSSSHTQPTSME